MKTTGDHNFHDGKLGSAITVRVTPRSSKNQIYEILDDGTIKVRLTASPVDGQANHALIRFLAEVLEISLSSIEIIAGFTGKDKLVAISNLDSETVQKRILTHLAE